MSNINDFVIENGVLLYYNGTDPHAAIPDSVTEIGNENVLFWSELENISIPKSVIKINEIIFNLAKVESITVEEGNPVYHSSGNCLIETASGKLIAGCKNSVIPDDGSVKILGKYCFRGVLLKRVCIPDSVTSLEEGAFRECGWLESVEIPTSVTSLGNECFCESGIERILIPSSVTEIGEYCFGGRECELTIYADEDSYAASYVEDNEDSDFGLDCPENYEEKIIEDFACDGNNGCMLCYTGEDTHIVVPEYINFLGGGCFADDKNVKSIILRGWYTCIGEGVFEGCKSLEYIVWPDMVAEMSYRCFAECSGLKVMFVPDGVESIGRQCFADCTSLECIFIPETVEEIADDAFEGCDKLTIYTTENSYAAEYAEEKGINVKIVVDSNPYRRR